MPTAKNFESGYAWKTWPEMPSLVEEAVDILSRDTIPKGSRLVVHEFLPQKVDIRGQTIVVYDLELMKMLCADWAKQGLTRDEIYDIWLEPAPRLIDRGS